MSMMHSKLVRFAGHSNSTAMQRIVGGSYCLHIGDMGAPASLPLSEHAPAYLLPLLYRHDKDISKAADPYWWRACGSMRQGVKYYLKYP